MLKKKKNSRKSRTWVHTTDYIFLIFLHEYLYKILLISLHEYVNIIYKSYLKIEIKIVMPKIIMHQDQVRFTLGMQGVTQK